MLIKMQISDSVSLNDLTSLLGDEKAFGPRPHALSSKVDA